MSKKRKRKRQKGPKAQFSHETLQTFANICCQLHGIGYTLPADGLLSLVTFYRADIDFEKILVDYLESVSFPFVVAIEKGCRDVDLIEEQMREVCNREKPVICIRNVPSVVLDEMWELPKVAPFLN